MSFSFPKVELHLHIDGAIRHETIWELAQKKNIDLAGAKSLEELKEKVITKTSASLDHVLQAFIIFMPSVIGDIEAIERIAYELCEDQAKQGVVYFEGRFSPHFLSNTHKSRSMNPSSQYHEKGDPMKHGYIYEILRCFGTREELGCLRFAQQHEVTPEQACCAVIRGLERGEKDFNVKARIILCCIRSHPHWSQEILELVHKYRDHRIVGIDVAGCAHAGASEVFDKEEAQVFKEAMKLGLHRTVHAGESGTAADVDHAIQTLHAERIGHGYHALDDPQVYKYMLDHQIHFEVCPTSSWCTGAVTVPFAQHPAVTLLKDNASFSISTDDPTCFGNYLNDELKVAKEKMGFTELQLWQCQLNAARACFLPESEKQELMKLIEAAKPK